MQNVKHYMYIQRAETQDQIGLYLLHSSMKFFPPGMNIGCMPEMCIISNSSSISISIIIWIKSIQQKQIVYLIFDLS